jgi:drug/metabolite transporter (DMT)-like permease
MIVLVGLIWAVYRAIMYYGYLNLGIVFTTMLFILSPVFLLVFAVVFLKEKLSLKQVIITAIIVACVAASLFV